MKTFILKARPKDQTYALYRATCAAKRMAPMSEDAWKALPIEGADEGGEGEDGGEAGGAGEGDEAAGASEGGEEEEEDEGGGEDVGKSLTDLERAIGAYDAVVDAAAPAGISREAYLKARLDAGTISKSEQAELGRIWAGTAANPEVTGTGAALRKSLQEYLSDESAQLVDASPILKSLFDGVQERLDGVHEQVASDGRATRELVVATGKLIKSMAGVINGQQRVIKALEQRLGVVETTPAPRRSVATPPRGTQVHRDLGKAGYGGAATTELTKAQVLTGLRALTSAAMQSGDRNTVAVLTHETAKFESGGTLSEGVRRSVESVLAAT